MTAEEKRSINNYRQLTRYTVATVITSIAWGTAFYAYCQHEIREGRYDHAKAYLFQMSLTKHWGGCLSLLLPLVLFYALAKRWLLNRNGHIGWNIVLFFATSVLFLFMAASLTWGIGVGGGGNPAQVLVALIPFVLFPLCLWAAQKCIKAV